MDANQQIVSIDLDGNLETLRYKRGAGLDLRDVGGELAVRRVSEIEWDDALAGFTIRMLPADAEPFMLTIDRLHEEGMSFSQVCTFVQLKSDALYPVHSYNGTLTFHDYEDAVRVEVLYLNTNRLNGTHVW